MKKLATLLVLSSLFFASCTKQNVNPANGSSTGTAVTTRDISVEYRITNESADVQIEFIAPSSTGQLQKQTQTISKTYYTIAFTAKSNNTFSIKAWNTDPSLKNITVDIYVDGQLFQSGSLNHSTATASASGIVK